MIECLSLYSIRLVSSMLSIVATAAWPLVQTVWERAAAAASTLRAPLNWSSQRGGGAERAHPRLSSY